MELHVRKIAIRTMVVHLTTHEKISGFFSLSKFMLIFLGLCCAGCSYQVYDRIDHYLSDPVVVDVSLNVVTEDDEFKVIFFYPFSSVYEDYNPAIVNLTVEKLWQELNISTLIDEAYFSKSGKKYRNAPLEYDITESGTCITINYGDASLPIADTSVSLNLAFIAEERLFYMIRSNNVTFIWQYLGSYEYYTDNIKQYEIRITLEKYRFLNRKNKKCTELEDYEACTMNCYIDVIYRSLNNCRYVVGLQKTAINLMPTVLTVSQVRLPFENFPDRANLTKCLVSKSNLSDIQSILYNIKRGYRRVMCTCAKPCTHRLYERTLDFTTYGKLQLKLQSNVMRNIEERRAYLVVSLLCDIGGSLSLFFGICCLTVVEIAMFFLQWLGFKKRSRVFTKRILFQRVSREFPKDKFRKLTLPQSKNGQRVYARLFYVIIGLICFVQICERIAYYFDYPTCTVIEFIHHDVDEFFVISCLGSLNILDKIDEFSNRFNISADNVDLVDLLDYSADFADANDLWQASSDIERYGTIIGYKAHQPVPSLTPFGNCTAIASRFLNIKISRSNCVFKYFFDSVDPRSITWKNYDIFLCHFIHQMNVNIQMIIRINSPRQPCMNATEADDCEQRCYQSRFLRNNITCKLPFIRFLDLPTCTTTKSAKYTKNAYLDAFLQTDPLKECFCHLRCTETLLSTTRTALVYADDKSSVIYVYNNMYKEVVTQILSFPIEKLICDIGSNLGSIVGISALSLFKLSVHCNRQKLQKLRLKLKR